MQQNTVCKTIRQYSSKPLSDEDMKKLKDIALDYKAIKNYVYSRYSGIGGLQKLYPGYTIQNEMTKSGLREQLQLPSVYFYLAIFDALGDIKNQWTKRKKRVLQAAAKNENFTSEELHYLRFVIKVNNCFESILCGTELILPKEIKEKYDEVSGCVNVTKLNNYLRRQIRKQNVRLHTNLSDGFAISERAYRYADHGIYISTKEKRKRVYVPLTDNCSYQRQLCIQLKEGNRLEIIVPVDIHVKKHADYENEVGLAAGFFQMLVTDNGNVYGEQLGELAEKDAEWMQEQTRRYRRNKNQNIGRKKYFRNKEKKTARLHSYINAELNRFLREEKPKVIYIPKRPPHNKGGKNKIYNWNINMGQRGYIRKRLIQKCQEHSVEIVEVFGKDISNICSMCGNLGIKEHGIFRCSVCGMEINARVNAAKNAKIRGQERS